MEDSDINRVYPGDAVVQVIDEEASSHFKVLAGNEIVDCVLLALDVVAKHVTTGKGHSELRIVSNLVSCGGGGGDKEKS